jgi:thioesterase domain-containing protein
VGGNVLVFARLSKLLGDDQPFYGLQAQGLDGHAKPFVRIEDMARYYIEEIRSVQPHGPYHIGGTCTGGLVAYEMAQQLMAVGERVVLAIMESWHPSSYRRYWGRAPYFFLPAILLARKVSAYLRVMMTCHPREWFTLTRDKFRSVWHHVQDIEDRRYSDQLLYRDQVSYATFHAAARYEFKPYPGCLLNIIASRRPVVDAALDTRLAFTEAAAKNSRTVSIAAEDSGRLFISPHVQELARHLQEFWSSETQPSDADSPASSTRAA